MLYKYPRVPNFTPFCSTIARFPDLEVFEFYIGYNGEFDIFEKKIVKNQRIKISKIAEKKFQKKSIEVFTPLWSHVNENEKYS